MWVHTQMNSPLVAVLWVYVQKYKNFDKMYFIWFQKIEGKDGALIILVVNI